MKHFTLLESPSEKFIKLAVTKMAGNPEMYGAAHPQEDFLMKSEKYPIFVVADGVTLIQYVIDKKEYPNPSPAGEVARIFCEEFIRAAEEKYDSLTESDIPEIFKKANGAVGKYNQNHGRTKETSDFWNNDLYAATAAFAIVKDSKVFWGSICDSYVNVFDSQGQIKFSSPQCDDLKQAEAVRFAGDPSDRKARAQYAWSTLRNRMNEKGERIGYGVVTGELEALEYLSMGSFDLKSGDIIVILTDGFEDHMKLPEFVALLTAWPTDLDAQIKKFTLAKAEENPEIFGHERSLILVRN